MNEDLRIEDLFVCATMEDDAGFAADETFEALYLGPFALPITTAIHRKTGATAGKAAQACRKMPGDVVHDILFSGVYKTAERPFSSFEVSKQKSTKVKIASTLP